MNSKTIVFGLGALLIFGGLLFGISKIPAQAPGQNSGTNSPVQTGGQSSIAIARINQTLGALDVKVTPTEVVEDSRCPAGVQCIQAGTVRVRVKLESGLGTANEIFTLNQPITTEAEQVTLISVQPEPVAGQTRDPQEYVFTFKIEKRIF